MDAPVASVEVLHTDGRWYSGTLERWRRDPDGWRGFVRFTTEPGMQYIHWVLADRLRPAEQGEAHAPVE